jgi:hypothetical protein
VSAGCARCPSHAQCSLGHGGALPRTMVAHCQEPHCTLTHRTRASAVTRRTHPACIDYARPDVRARARRRVVAADVQKLVEGGGKAPAAEPSQAAPAPVRPGVRGMPARASVACTHQVDALQCHFVAVCAPGPAPGPRPACRPGFGPDVYTAHACSLRRGS